MKIHTLAIWGAVIALAQQQVAALKDQPSCVAHEDCPEGGYCASDGTCEKIGGCATRSDCFIAENQGYPVAACIGSLDCGNRRCSMKCSGLDVEFPCSAERKCLNDGMYCTSRKVCGNVGSCASDEDCFKEENVFAEIGCVGTKYCDATGMCAKECTTEAAPVRAACETSTDCADGEYCGRNGGCLSSGFCETLSDCFMPGHDLVFPACVGTVLCETGMCTKNCDGGKPLPEPLPAAGGNPGVIGGNEAVPENTTAVDISIFCTTDDDCNSKSNVTTATTRSAFPGDEMYCAAGTCKHQGHCSTDNDCINPSNIYFNDKRCAGYLFCTEQGTCDRECSTTCKDGSLMAQCFADACDTNDWASCQGADSCIMTTCNGTCDFMIFDAAGNVLPECVIGEDPIVSNGSISRSKEDSTDFVTSEGATSTQSMNLESSATAARATSVLALLVLGVAMV